MEKKIDYDKLTEITVKSQEELDMIPENFGGRIYIEFGTWDDKAVVSKRYRRSVEARNNSSVVARDNSSVVARDNSSVEAWDNSFVVARDNTQVLNMLTEINGKIEISGNARIVYNPRTIHEYLDFYGIKHDEKKATFYKAVRKDNDGIYYSDHNNDFVYEIGAEKEETHLCKNVNKDCGAGIHISHLAWAIDYGSSWSNLAILEVEADIDSVIVPVCGNGKVRTNKVKVIREVPLEECGLYGKILAKRKAVKA